MLAPDIVVVVCLVVVGVTASSFILVLVRGRSAAKGTAASLSSRMNQVALVTVLSPLGYLFPGLLQTGSTPPVCELIQRIMANSVVVTYWLVLNFFLVRSQQVAPPSPVQDATAAGALLALLALFVYNLFAINRDLVTWVDADAFCDNTINNWTTGLYGFVLPCLLEGAVAVRFVWLVRRHMMQSKSNVSPSLLRRLLVVTCAVQLTTLMGDAFITLYMMGVVPTFIPRQMSVIVTSQATYKACSVAWPVIIIAILKCRRARRINPTVEMGASAMLYRASRAASGAHDPNQKQME